MNKTTMICLIVAASLLLLGGVIFVITMTIHHWDFRTLDKTRYATVTHHIEEPFDSVSVQTRTTDVTFLPSEDGSCRVECRDTEQVGHLVSVENGTLRITRKDERKWYDHINFFSFGSHAITVYLPKAEYNKITVQGSTGDVLLEQLSAGEIDVEITTGDVALSSVVCRGGISTHTTTGYIALTDVQAASLDAELTTGDVALSSVVCRGEISTHTSTGDIALTDVQAASLDAELTTGDMKLLRVTVTGEMEIEGSTGDVTLDACDAGTLDIEITTGNVTGTLLSPKIFYTESTTGKVDVPKSVTGGMCEISTTTGDIKFSILQP